MLVKLMYIKKYDKVFLFYIRFNVCINIFDFYVYSLVESKLNWGKKNLIFLYNNLSFVILDVSIYYKV